MNGAVIIDLAVLAALLGFAAFNARRGFVRSVAGLVIFLTALVGAALLTSALTPVAADLVRPHIEKRVEARLEAALDGGAPASSADGAVSAVEPVAPTPGDGAAQSGEAAPAEDGTAGLSAEVLLAQAERLLRQLHLDREIIRPIAEDAREKVLDTGASVMTAVVQGTAETVLRAGIFLLSFALLTLALRLFTGTLDLMAKLPGLHLANRLCGAALGLCEGVLAVFLAIWLLRRLGVRFDTALVAQTQLLRYFTTHTPLDVLSIL